MRSIGGPDRPRTEGGWLVQAKIVVVVSTTIIPDFVSDIITKREGKAAST